MAKFPPSYQYYPNDFDGSTSGWSIAEVGLYQRLLNEQWVNGFVPDEEEKILRISRATPEEFKSCWPTVSGKFDRAEDGQLRNSRLERERYKALEYRKLQAEKGRAGGKARAKSAAQAAAKPELKPEVSRFDSPEQALQSSSSTTTSEGEASASPSNYVEQRTVLSYPCRGKPKQWGLTEEQVEKWRALYPGLDVMGCCRKALAWCEADGRRRKTAAGMPRFLVNWINREVDRGTSRLEDSNGDNEQVRVDLAGRPESDRLCRLRHGEPLGSDPENPKYRDILALSRLAGEVGIGEAWAHRFEPPVTVPKKPPPLCPDCEDAYKGEDHDCQPPEAK